MSKNYPNHYVMCVPGREAESTCWVHKRYRTQAALTLLCLVEMAKDVQQSTGIKQKHPRIYLPGETVPEEVAKHVCIRRKSK